LLSCQLAVFRLGIRERLIQGIALRSNLLDLFLRGLLLDLGNTYLSLPVFELRLKLD
jgi:hypothetical protein